MPNVNLETLRGLLGIHATQPVVVDHGLYQLDENMYVLLKTNNANLNISDAIEYSCAKDERSVDICTEDCVYVHIFCQTILIEARICTMSFDAVTIIDKFRSHNLLQSILLLY